MNGQEILMYGLIAAALLALWFVFKIVKKIVFVLLVVVAIVGIAVGLYLKFF